MHLLQTHTAKLHVSKTAVYPFGPWLGIPIEYLHAIIKINYRSEAKRHKSVTELTGLILLFKLADYQNPSRVKEINMFIRIYEVQKE
jgi:hypothetical protein